MPLLCGIMLLFTLLRLPIYLSYLVFRFIFFSIPPPFFQRDASKCVLFPKEKSVFFASMKIIHHDYFYLYEIVEIYIFNSKKKKERYREGNS